MVRKMIDGGDKEKYSTKDNVYQNHGDQQYGSLINSVNKVSVSGLILAIGAP